jgi:RNA polymerase subunit RPABC4/transcription elongation factor Spt4
VTITSRPGASGRPEAPTGEARVEYRLVRNAVVRDVRKGKLGVVDVCDAHPELLRAARNVGKPSGDRCPICESTDTVQVTYVFGSGLPPGGRCPGSATELDRLCHREDPVLCYDVEVCPSCAWHHLTRKYPAGGRAPQARRVRQGG